MSSTTIEKSREKNELALRKDAWWLEPTLNVIALVSFIIYATWAALQNAHYEYGPYVSPFYSPHLSFSWWNFSPAFLILWIPAGFRASCYFYRRVYYRSFFMDPPSCAISESCKKNYTGETKFPFFLNNLHRYFLYFAICFVVLHWTDVIKAFNFNGQFGIGTGSIVLFLDALLLSFYVFSCHSFRHLIGGSMNTFKCGYQHKAYEKVSCANEMHGVWAWASLFMVGFADVYVRLCSMGIWTDLRIL